MTVRFRRTPLPWGLLPLVVSGGAVGVTARYLLTADAADPLQGLPVILAVNVLGSGLLGMLVGWAGDRPRLRAFLGTGVLGGFTSYSALAPVLALAAAHSVETGAQSGLLVAGGTLLLFAGGGALVLVALPVGVAAAGYALGARAARRRDA
ncbi:CrcB family protein [Microbacterium sp. Marseille-Q6965]|uniref:FluC/FEX family fluoride channel n=1 Tax=Microbacterium sp. Marseille-Q6965 TaxID=2965072 RepID=UPI0021B7CCDE|nr:CrcB family protein [Microbacterium sp. Marseille-Q6965]